MIQTRMMYVGLVLATAMIMFVTPAMAAPIATPFLSVDVNGYNAGGGQAKGPTEAGYEDFEGGEGLGLDPAVNWGGSGATGLTNTYSTSEGDISATIIGTGSSLGARERGANSGGLPDLLRDFVFSQRDGANAYGRNYIKLQLSGLTPGQKYEVTLHAREQAFDHDGDDDPQTSHQAWTDLAALGGVDGPAAWLDANVGQDASYQPIFVDDDMDPNTPDVDTGYKNPIPTLARSQVSGPDALSMSDPYFHSASIVSTADGNGDVIVYGWSDPNGFGQTVQGASLLNGFAVGVIPEPTSAVLFVAGLIGITGVRRRNR